MRLLTTLAFLAASCSAPATLIGFSPSTESPVVYGRDNRKDYYQVKQKGPSRIMRRSNALLMDAEEVEFTRDGARMRLDSRYNAEDEDICEGEKFYDQPTAGFCSGTLIADDLVLTAGHCIDDESCPSTWVAFRFMLRDDDRLARQTARDFYSCAEVMAHGYDALRDYAIIRLDRKAARHLKPAKVAERQQLKPRSSVSIIGHPYGLPVKLAREARVMDPAYYEGHAFVADLDAFAGNSGSGVYHKGKVVGILTEGEPDFELDPERGCLTVNRLPAQDDRYGEVAQYAADAIDELCESGYEDPRQRLCR